MAKGKTDKLHLLATMTKEANEWGIPDWRDSVDYGDVTHWSLNRWRWEFYRRRDDLRMFFDCWAASRAERNLICNMGTQPHEPGFTAFGLGEDAGEAIRRFDYIGVPNPRIGDQPRITIMPCDEVSRPLRYFNPRKRQPTGFSVLAAIGRKTAQHYDLSLEPHEYAIKFNLNKPLAPQLQEAQLVLKKNQKAMHGKVVQRKRLLDKWLGYLRALDAREAMQGASWREYTDALFSEGLLDRHKSPSGGYCNPPPQAGRDLWKAADALRFNF